MIGTKSLCTIYLSVQFHMLLASAFISLEFSTFDLRKLKNVIVLQFSDGCMDAIILRDCPKADLLALLMKMSDGSYVKSPYVTYLKVSFSHPVTVGHCDLQ